MLPVGTPNGSTASAGGTGRARRTPTATVSEAAGSELRAGAVAGFGVQRGCDCGADGRAGVMFASGV